MVEERRREEQEEGGERSELPGAKRRRNFWVAAFGGGFRVILMVKADEVGTIAWVTLVEMVEEALEGREAASEASRFWDSAKR